MKRSIELLIAAGAVACAGGSPGVVEVPMTASEGGAPIAIAIASEPPPVAPRNPDLPFARGDRWKGSYFCAQGRTTLALLVDDVDEDGFAVVFAFEFPGSATHVPATGSIRMRGSWEGKAKTIKLKSEHWIDQPAGYEMVDLIGNIGRTGVITGSVVGPGCSSFTVTPDPPRKSFP